MKTRSTVHAKPEGNQVHIEVVPERGRTQTLKVTRAEAQGVFEVLAQVLGYEVQK